MKKVITLLCILCSSLPALTQKNGFLLHDIRLPQEFNQQIIISLEQDKRGLLWFVTNNGLYRFDGTDVIHLGPESTPSIPHTEISTLFADQQENLWVGSKDGLTRLDLQTWETSEIKFKSGQSALTYYVKTVSEGKNGVIYAGCQDGKVYKVVADSMELICDINRFLPGTYDLPNITFMEEPYPNELWFGSVSGKVICVRIKEDGTYSDPEFYGLDIFKDEQIVDAVFGPAGIGLIAAPAQGLFLLNTKTGTFRKYKGKYGDLGTNGQVFMTSLNKEEALLLTNTPGIGKQKLFIYNFLKDTLIEEQLNFPNYLKDNHISWFSHTGSMILLSLNEHLLELGVSKSSFTSLMSEPKSLNSIRAIYKEPGGKLYAGSYKDGFLMLDEKRKEQKVVARKYVYSILPWNKDSLLLSTEGDGLLWYEPQKDRLTKLDIPIDRTAGIPMGKYLTFILRHDSKRVLVGTYERLYLVNPNERTARAVREDQLFRTRILGLLKQDENYLIATERGILKWNSTTDTISNFWENDSSRSSNKIGVNGMVVVSNQIWAGTGGRGILVLNKQGQVLDSIDRTDGLAANIVFTLTATSKYVIAGTKNGLSVINRHSGEIRNYSTLDQLPANEFNTAATFQIADTVYLGTINGIAHFNTDQLSDLAASKEFTPLYLTDLAITDHNGELLHDYTWPYDQKDEIIIPAKTPFFSVDFGSMGEGAQSLSYFYRLQAEDQWSALGATRKISFVGMDPGRYQLQLAACLPDGKWTKTLFSMPLIVTAAYYQTIWFKVLVGILILLFGWGLLKYREKQIEKERLLRLKIAGDLHDEVGSTLAGISMQADMLLTGHEAHMKQYLKNIADNGRLAVQTMGDIVWSIDSRNDDSSSLSQRMERYGHKIFDASEISLEFKNEGFNDKQYIPQKVRQNIMLIYKEALTNIIKHAAASHVKVTLSTLNKGFMLVINDNGKGISHAQAALSQEQSSGHGLRNMRMRAKDIGAELVLPVVEKGLMIVLTWKS